MLGVPLCHQLVGRFADVVAVQDRCRELGAVVQVLQHGWVGAEKHVEFAVHADGGGERPQSVYFDRIP